LINAGHNGATLNIILAEQPLVRGLQIAVLGEDNTAKVVVNGVDRLGFGYLFFDQTVEAVICKGGAPEVADVSSARIALTGAGVGIDGVEVPI